MARKRTRSRPNASPPAKPKRGKQTERILAYAGLAAALLFLVIVRIHLLPVPLERDEGGFAAVAQAAGDGRPLYTDLRDTKLPGLYVVYGLFMKLFGTSPAGIHTGLLVCNLATLLILFGLGRKLFDSLTAAVATLAYSLLAVGPGVFGFAAHAMQLLVLPGLGGVALLWLGLERRRRLLLLLAGLLFGIAFTIKQPSVHYMLFGGVFLLVTRLRETPRRWGATAADLGVLILGSIAPYLAVVLVMAATGRLAPFWFWTVTWPSEYAATVTLSERIGFFTSTFANLVRGVTGLWVLAGLGLVFTLMRKEAPGRRPFLVLLLGFTLAAVCTGFHFYPHYFVIMLAPVSLLIGRFVAVTGAWLGERLGMPAADMAPLAVFLLVWVLGIRAWPEYYTHPDGTRILRTIYGANPFPESVAVGNYIRERRNPGDSMAVIGSEPQLYLYADCRPATGHFFMYPLVDGRDYDTRLQDELIHEVETAEPRFLVFVQVNTSWLDKGTGQRIFTWFDRYTQAHYRQVGVVDIFLDTTLYHWGDDAAGYASRSSVALRVYERQAS